MRTLIVRQSIENGASRSWKIRPAEGTKTLGSSRLANLTSLDAHSHGIEGVFEHRNDRWFWLHMSASELEVPAETEIKDGAEIKLKGSTLSFSVQVKDQVLFERLTTKTGAEASTGTQAYDLEIVKFGDKVVSTRVLKAGSAEPTATRALRKWGGEKVTVLRRAIHLNDSKDITKMRLAEMDKESKIASVAVAVCVFLFTGAALFGPHSSMEPMASLPPVPQKVTIAMNPMKVKKGTILEKKVQQAQKAPAPGAGADNSSSGGKVAGILRAVNSGRLSTLLGKVSAQAARSRQVIVQNGVKAGDGPSGAALSTLGKVDQAGGDWSNAATGAGVTVSTAGKGGGKGLGFGKLSAGGTGKGGGVGLIEDESEVSGGLDREVIAQTIKSYLGQILYCYERQLSANPDLFGKVAVRFTIGPVGAVIAQAIGDTTLKNATVEGCILNKVAAWKFPTPSGGTTVNVTYPFLFKSTN